MDDFKDEVKELFNEIKARLTSPLLGSYLIAWLVINWQIPVYIFFYTHAELHQEGHLSLIWAIKSKLSLLNNIYPLLAALAYVWAFPFIKSRIKEHQVNVSIDSENKIIEFMSRARSYSLKIEERDSQIANLNLRIEEMKRSDQAKDAAAKRNLDEVKRLSKEVDRLTGDMQFNVQKVKNIDLFNSYQSLTGKWKVQFSQNGIFLGKYEEWIISGSGQISVNGRLTYDITDLISSYEQSSINLTSNMPNKNMVLFMTTPKDGNSMTGHTSDKRQVIFSRDID